MNILHVIDDLAFGGAERLLMDYIPELKKYNHFVLSVCGNNLYEINNFTLIPCQLDPKKDFFKVIKKVNQVVKTHNIDIVHSHTYWTNLATRFLKPKVKVINHYHFADYKTKKNNKVKCMILMDRFFSNKSTIRVAVSLYLQKVLEEKLKCKKIFYIPNFIKPIQYSENRQSKKESMFSIIAVGNINTDKNYGLILAAFELLINENISIDIIGGGDKLESLKKLSNEKGLNNITFLGGIENARLKLKDHDLYLSSSISETFGISVLEAVNAELPLLLSDIPAFGEIAPAGTVFFPLDNPKLLAEKIIFLRNNNSPINQNSYNECLEKYSVENFIVRLNNLYISKTV